jgi:hypothetical protein
MEQYYNKDTLTLTIPVKYDEEIKGIPEETEKIIFEEDIEKDIFPI